VREVEQMGEELKQLRNDAFDPPWTTLNVGEIHGGTAKNVVPAECMFLVEWRPVPGQEPELVAERLRDLIAGVDIEGVTVELDVRRMDSGFETPAESAVIRAVSAQKGGHAQTIAFGTEAPWMARMGAEAVVIGPGSMLTAHSPRECVPQKELDDCVQLLLTAIENLCG
jgi:acetylornithine deacetylase